MKLYVWSRPPSFLAVAQADSVEAARRVLIEQEIGQSGDGSCPERDRAREIVKTTNPVIWMGLNAEFALTDSAECRELAAYIETQAKTISLLKINLERLRDVAKRSGIEYEDVR
jgi:hypothetical protein